MQGTYELGYSCICRLYGRLHCRPCIPGGFHDNKFLLLLLPGGKFLLSYTAYCLRIPVICGAQKVRH